jgi:hypothetical protein
VVWVQPPDLQLHHLLQRLHLVSSPGTQAKAGHMQGIDEIKNISPIAWQHINLHGRYEFQKQPDLLSLDAIIQGLME